MRRISIMTSIVMALFLSLFFTWYLTLPQVQAQKPAPPEVQKPAVAEIDKADPTDMISLPITRVVLFTSGVSYYERSGEVDGNRTLDLSFRVADINDVLKSLMVQDMGGGRISPVGYDSYDPLSKTLKSYSLDLTNNPTFAQLLNQARGAKVEISWQGKALKGSIVGVERQRQSSDKDVFVEIDMLNVLTAEGLRNLPLPQVQHVRFLNSTLQGDLQKALDVLASAHDTHKRTVRLHFQGQGKRQVRVAYVLDSPIWETSYRLAMGKEKDKEKLFLQGWGLVNNTTDEDWQGVQVTLVSGRPISFEMDLYTPLYVHHPMVKPELFANLRPPVYGVRMAAAGLGGMAKEEQDGLRMQNRAVERRAVDELAAAPAVPLWRSIAEQQGLPAMAKGKELGDFFQYVIEQPIDLPRQKAAMLPIINKEIDGTKYSIYDARVLPENPLLGLNLKNTTKFHLLQGPITVFEGDTYAGDARIRDMEPKEERLISYAVDLGMEVNPVEASAPNQLQTVKIVRGILYANSRLQQTKTYKVKNRTDKDRMLLIEHPIRPNWKLLDTEKPFESSRDVYRFLVAVPAGKTASLKVVEQQNQGSEMALTNANDQMVRLYLSSTVVSPKVKEALEKATTFRTKLAETTQELMEAKQQIKDIGTDQVRIRADMERLPQNSPLFQRYLKKLDGQETQIEQLQEKIASLRQLEIEQRKNYEAFLVSLDIQ